MRLSPLRRRELFDALRRGTVPQHSLDLLAVGLERFEGAITDELEHVRLGASAFKAIRGEYGTGKTFFIRWLQERARKQGFATAEVQLSETETPLHRLETVYRRAMENLSTAEARGGALRQVVEAWGYSLEQDALQTDEGGGEDAAALEARVDALMEKRLAGITRSAPQFSAVLRAWRRAMAAGDFPTADALLAWLAGQPNVGAAARRYAGIKGEIDHFGAMGFLRGLLFMLRDAGYPGLVLVLDEVETLQRVRGDVREKGLNALRQWIDELDAGRFPGLYLAITGTQAFFEGPQGVQRLPPLAQRLHVNFGLEARFDNPRAPQLRLNAFDLGRLILVGQRVRDLFADGSEAGERIRARCDDTFLDGFARAVVGRLGGQAGIAPRLYLKKLVTDILDRVELFPDFDPHRDGGLEVSTAELNDLERQAASVDDIPLELDG